MTKITCEICPHHCSLKNGQSGLCRARSNKDNVIVPVNYGMITGIALDPIEKKPLRNFYPGSKILSVGSFGCNLNCEFCQNYEISMTSKDSIQSRYIAPEELAEAAEDLITRGNIGIAYTYNEPLIGYEYVRDCSVQARQKGLKNVLVTNGCFCVEPLEDLFPYIDAMNIDLKGFTEDFYRKIGGSLEAVKKFIIYASKKSHVEITTLIIPGENDSEDEIRELSEFIAEIDYTIPLHLSRFFPCYKMSHKKATEVGSVYNLAKIARESLDYVYEGNC